MKHKWYHFIYGTEIKREVVFRDNNIEIANVCNVCKKCGEQVGGMWGSTTVHFEVEIKKK